MLFKYIFTDFRTKMAAFPQSEFYWVNQGPFLFNLNQLLNCIFVLCLKHDLDSQIKDMNASQNDYDNMYSKYNDTTREIKKLLNEVSKQLVYARR